ncbi:MAG: hypothetical protein AVDCRST_MAG59-876 [uncultured Thermomicrobiales bacterium]|uniref:Uncharacterized protein n=1 Tax=uncultured Thermomicrobiales bacterium TaxID=1645740 RepID=A0A6J4U893_9BACT|nr:MAG: hypothetical protein AVDCRST_MAG59-876 [uncultured Thermomicrobiales bacterium]
MPRAQRALHGGGSARRQNPGRRSYRAGQREAAGIPRPAQRHAVGRILSAIRRPLAAAGRWTTGGAR